MTNETLTRLNSIFRDVMDNESISLTEATTARDIAEWDSLSHVLMLAAVEKQFGMKFTASEIQRMQNVGDLIALIHARRVS
jgi:acyl carrier protein